VKPVAGVLDTSGIFYSQLDSFVSLHEAKNVFHCGNFSKWTVVGLFLPYVSVILGFDISVSFQCLCIHSFFFISR